MAEARDDFFDHGRMYDAGDGIDEFENPSNERKAMLSYVFNGVRKEVDSDAEKLSDLLRKYDQRM